MTELLSGVPLSFEDFCVLAELEPDDITRLTPLAGSDARPLRTWARLLTEVGGRLPRLPLPPEPPSPERGEPGAAGLGIRSLGVDDAGRLLIHLTDGSTQDLGSVWRGGEGETVDPAARLATRRVITPEHFGAPTGFDPAYAGSLWGTPEWKPYLESKSASEALQRCLQDAAAHPGTVIRLCGDYYFGELPLAKQRELGRTIYGPPGNLRALGTGSQAWYARMPVAGEGIRDLTIEGVGCRLYHGASHPDNYRGPNTILAFMECDGVSFTGTGQMYGFLRPGHPLEDEENQAQIRLLLGTRRVYVGPGWELRNFSGDGVLVGGAATDNAGIDPAYACRDVIIEADIRERVGNNLRPWYKYPPPFQARKTYAADGQPAGSRSRLCVAVIHAERVDVRSQRLAGGVDIEPNLTEQLANDCYVRDAKFQEVWVLPHGDGAGRHPWQEEPVVPPNTPGAVRIENNIIYTSRSDTMVFRGGGIHDIEMEHGWIYVHNGKKVPINGVKFGVGTILYGNQGRDEGLTTSDGIVRNVYAREALEFDIYGIYAEEPPPNSKSVVVLLGNVRNCTFEDITVADAGSGAIEISPVFQHNGGNSEEGCRYVNIKNLGEGAGEGRTLKFTPHTTSVEIGTQSTRQLVQRMHVAPTSVTLDLPANGFLDYAARPAGEYVLTNLTPDDPDNGPSYPAFYGLSNMATLPDGAPVMIRVAGRVIEDSTGDPTDAFGLRGIVVPNSRYVGHRGGWGGRPLILTAGDWIAFQKQGSRLVEVDRGLAPVPLSEVPAGASPKTLNAQFNALLRIFKRRGVVSEPVDAGGAPVLAENLTDADHSPRSWRTDGWSAAPLVLAQDTWAALPAGNAPVITVPALPAPRPGHRWELEISGMLRVNAGKTGFVYVGITKSGAALGRVSGGGLVGAGLSPVYLRDVQTVTGGETFTVSLYTNAADGDTLTLTSNPYPLLWVSEVMA